MEMTKKLEAALITLRNAEIELDATPMPRPRTKALGEYYGGVCQRRNDAVQNLLYVLLPEAKRIK